MVVMGVGRTYSVITCMVLTAFIGTVAFRVSIPAVAYYTRDILESSALGIGLLTSAFFGARALSAIASGRLCDKYGRKLLYISSASFAVNALVVNLYPQASTIEQVILIRLGQGLLNGIAWVPIQVFLGRVSPNEVRGRVYSIYFALGSLGGMVGNVVYSALVSTSLSTIMHVSSLCFIASSLTTLTTSVLVKEHVVSNLMGGRGGASGKASYGGYVGLGLISIAPIVVVIVGSSMFNSVVRGDLIYIYMNEALSLKKEVVAQYVAIAILASLPTSYLLSWVSDRVSEGLALKVSLAMAVAGASILYVSSGFHALVALLMIYGGFSGIVPIARRLAISRFRLGGTALGIVNASGNLGNVAGSAIAGYVYDSLTKVYGSTRSVVLLMMAPLVIAFLSSFLIRSSKS